MKKLLARAITMLFFVAGLTPPGLVRYEGSQMILVLETAAECGKHRRTQMTKFLLAAAAALFLSLSAAQAAEEPNYTDLRSACAEVTVDERDECSYLVARIETAHYEIKFHRRNLLLAATVKNRDVTANSIQNITDLFVVVDNASVSLKTNFSDVWAVTE